MDRMGNSGGKRNLRMDKLERFLDPKSSDPESDYLYWREMKNILESEPLYEDLRRQIDSGGDNAMEILSLLHEYGFEERLPEQVKMNILVADPCANFDFQHDIVMLRVIREDSVYIMRALLPMIPTYRLQTRNLPKEYEWVRDDQERWEEVLKAEKSRWSPGACECPSHTKPATQTETLCALNKLASDLLAAKLFFMGVCGHSKRCMLYLLSVCPQLLRYLPIPAQNRPHLLTEALSRSTVVADTLLDKSLLQNLEHMMPELLISLCSTVFFETFGFLERYMRDRVRVFVSVAGRLYKDKLVQYRGEDGSSLLHLVCKQEWGDMTGDGLHYLKGLLEMGLDPAETNNEGKSALDIVVQQFCVLEMKHSWSRHRWNSVPRRALEQFHSFARVLLPYFQGKNDAIARITLPPLSPWSPDTSRWKECIPDVINVWRVVLDFKLFGPSMMETDISWAFLFGRFISMVTSPCLGCEPLNMLLHRAICDGFNFRASTIVYTLMTYIGLVPYYSIARPPSPDCCGWKVLELLIHHTAGLGDLTTEGLIRKLRPRQTILCVPLVTVRRVVSMIWKHDLPSKPLLEEFLQWLATTGHPEALEISAELMGLMAHVHPLQRLCRNSIVRSVQYKDIPKLGLPSELRRYVQIGELSDDHPVQCLMGIGN